MLITIFCSILGSTGLWKYLEYIRRRKDQQDDSQSTVKAMLRGLAHDRIISLGMVYIERGNITPDEYENLYEYLYKPYEALGGNGSAKMIMDEVNKLKKVKSPSTKKPV